MEVLDSAIFVLNKLTRNSELFTGSDLGATLAPWVILPAQTVRYDEVLDFTELIGPLFRAITRQDPDNAESMALKFAHMGLSCSAQLGITSELFDELGSPNSRPPVERTQIKQSALKK